MKLLLLALSLLISAQALAQMSAEEQISKVEEIAKTERRNMWRESYREVSSSVSLVTLNELNEMIRDNSNINEPLDRTQISALYSCYHRANCSLYLIDVNGEIYGARGYHRLWVMLNTMTGKYRYERHQVYAEE
ncbi:MAG: hypothetical protein LW878_00640 [Proteobacteria bacterium]|jgi:hypothetical protein|nr:hypothetical protein [Pseudomonadota bacterium]